MNKEEYAICPYNASHTIIRNRMPYHIVKCRQNYRGPPLSICPFNAMHIMPSTDIDNHVNNCPDYHLQMNKVHESQHPSNVYNNNN